MKTKKLFKNYKDNEYASTISYNHWTVKDAGWHLSKQAYFAEYIWSLDSPPPPSPSKTRFFKKIIAFPF